MRLGSAFEEAILANWLIIVSEDVGGGHVNAVSGSSGKLQTDIN